MDNSPEEMKSRVRSLTKAIRYKSKETGNLMKAFNDYMAQHSGISATERASVKSSLGLSESKWRTKKSDWRNEISETTDLFEVEGEENNKKIKEKKVNNKITINPTMGMKEAIEEIGGTIMEMEEIEEMMSPKELQLQKRKTMIDMQVARERRKEISKAGSKAPTKEVGEGYAPGDVDKKVGALTNIDIPKSEQDAAKARLLAKTKAKREKMKTGDNMGEDVETEGYEPMTPERKMRVDKAKKGAYDKDQRAQHQGDNKEADKQFKRRMAMDFKTKMRKEETEDSLRDRRMERGGVDGNNRYDKPIGKPNTFGRKKPDPKASERAFSKVKNDIIKKYGKGALK
jgi:hypothetical protein